MKKTISLLLVVTMLFCMIPAVSATSHPFTDVKDDDWYAGAVEYCYTNELMNGTGNTTFSPGTKMNRAMLVTVLYRIEGTPGVSIANPFVDVGADQYYYSAVLWAYNNGITTGTSTTEFSPNKEITREQMVTFFYRYAKSESCDTSASASLSGYADSGSVSSYAVDAFRWAVATGIINGTDATHLSPAGTANRAQCATIIQRYAEWTNGSKTEAPTEPVVPTQPSEPVASTVYGEGTYKAGKDIPAGEYIFTSTSKYSAYVCVSSDSNQDNIIENENFDYTFIATVSDGQYVQAKRCEFVSSSGQKININADGTFSDGMYRVGIDIPAGEYRLTSTTSYSAYYCIYNSSVVPFEIQNNDNFKGSTYVTVSDGQYLVIKRCTASPA